MARCSSIQLSDLRSESLLMRPYCEHFESLVSYCGVSTSLSIGRTRCPPHHLELFLEQGLGVAFVPQSVLFSDCVKRVPDTGLDLRRIVSLYGVAGRQRTLVAKFIMKMLRAADWSCYAAY